MSASSASLLMPDAEPAWRLWRSLASGKVETVDSPAECRERSKPVVIGLPATACRTVGLILPAAEAALLPSMIEAQLERRGITVKHDPAPNFAWHLLGQDAAHSLVSVDVLAQPFPDNLAVNHAANYTAALRLMALPQRGLVVVEEQGLLVLAASQQGKLWHSHVLGPADMPPAELARELDLARLAFESLDGFGPVRNVTLVGSRLAPHQKTMPAVPGLTIETTDALQPSRSIRLEGFQRLLPPSVHEAQARRTRRGRLMAISVVIALVYAAAIAGAAWHLNNLRQRGETLRADVAATKEPAAAIRDTAARWKAMDPAINPQRYPMVQLSQITALMPPSGVLIRRFETRHQEGERGLVNDIEINGDARDAQTVEQFKLDLKGNPKMSEYNWSSPVPSMKDRVASFKIQGRLEAN